MHSSIIYYICIIYIVNVTTFFEPTIASTAFRAFYRSNGKIIPKTETSQLSKINYKRNNFHSKRERTYLFPVSLLVIFFGLMSILFFGRKFLSNMELFLIPKYCDIVLR